LVLRVVGVFTTIIEHAVETIAVPDLMWALSARLA